MKNTSNNQPKQAKVIQLKKKANDSPSQKLVDLSSYYLQSLQEIEQMIVQSLTRKIN